MFGIVRARSAHPAPSALVERLCTPRSSANSTRQVTPDLGGVFAGNRERDQHGRLGEAGRPLRAAHHAGPGDRKKSLVPRKAQGQTVKTVRQSGRFDGRTSCSDQRRGPNRCGRRRQGRASEACRCTATGIAMHVLYSLPLGSSDPQRRPNCRARILFSISLRTS